MNIKKITAMLLALLMIILTLASCKTNTSNDNSTSDPTSQPSDVTSDVETTPKNTTEAVTTERPDYTKLPYTGKYIVKNTEIGMRIAKYVNTNPYVADVEITNTALILFCYLPGTTIISAEDFFGHKATISVTVKESTGAEGEKKKDLISATITPCTEKFIEVSNFGASANDSSDDTKAFQAAIDSAKPGETVYVYPGRYNVSLLAMREGITLKMYTEMTDAKVGYTDEIARAVSGNKYAILSGTRILNNENEAKGAEGCSNFSIIGGVFDTNITNRSTLIFGCADNVRLENIIFKDIKGNHTIQFTGCTNSVIENCMFAGYECGDVFTREIVQIEPSTPGATGGPLTFANGEYNCPKNITINNCYFGKSDEAGAPLMAIGHHSQVGEANVTGLKITNNIFDEVLYAAIRYNNLVDVEISGNTFISTSQYMNATQFKEATTPAFLVLYLAGGSSTYKTPSDQTITEAVASEQAGHHNMKIENNTFNIGAGSDKRVLYYTNQNIVPGVSYVNVIRQDKYDSPVYNFSGYSINKNYAENISFSNNTINIEGQPTYNNYYIRCATIYDLKFENNKINLGAGVKFTVYSTGFEYGQHLTAKNLQDDYMYTINTKTTARTITIKFGDKTYSLLCSYSGNLNIKKGAGGIIDATTDEKGNLTLNIIPSAGYKLGKITDASLNELTDSFLAFNSNTSLIITFEKIS